MRPSYSNPPSSLTGQSIPSALLAPSMRALRITKSQEASLLIFLVYGSACLRVPEPNLQSPGNSPGPLGTKEEARLEEDSLGPAVPCHRSQGDRCPQGPTAALWSGV